jgi:hypothetical protein
MNPQGAWTVRRAPWPTHRAAPGDEDRAQATLDSRARARLLVLARPQGCAAGLDGDQLVAGTLVGHGRLSADIGRRIDPMPADKCPARPPQRIGRDRHADATGRAAGALRQGVGLVQGRVPASSRS